MAATTLMSCGDPAGSFETAYLALLDQSRFYNVRVDTLTIRGADGPILLVFDAAPANPLLGSWIVESYASAPGSITAPLAGTELTAVFRLDKVGGSSGCNTYQGPYTTNGTVAAIGPLATTRMACADDVMAQETAFLAALQGVGKIELRAQRCCSRISMAACSSRWGGRHPRLPPPRVPSAAASASPGGHAPATPSPSLSPSPSPTPTPPRPPPRPPRRPRPRLRPAATPAPTVEPPASEPPTASCP